MTQNVPETFANKDWPRRVSQAINFLLRKVGGMGVASTANSTSTPLGISASFTGTWETNDYDQVGYNVQADQAGTFYLEISPDGGTTITKTVTKPVRADEPKFGALVKGAGRWVRARFVNGGVAQADFVLKTFYGADLFPFSGTDDGEIFTTVTERERNVFVNHSVTNQSATSYAVLIDLSDTTNFPHDESGRVDLSSVYIAVDRDSTGTGLVRIGVVKAINGTSATVGWVMGINFDKSNDQHINRDRVWSPSQLKCDVIAGETPHLLVVTSTGVTGINTATPLASPLGAGTVTPAVGDIVIEYNRTAGTYNASVGCFYHGEV